MLCFSQFDHVCDFVESKVQAAEKEYEHLSQKARDMSKEYKNLKSEMEELEDKLSTDFGKDNIFIPLSEACIEAFKDKYTYEICPFGSANQVEGGSRVSLGKFSRMEDGKMKFTDGQKCWQGPARSITVDISCGATDKLDAVTEPSRCTYAAHLKTPAACTPLHVENMKAEVERKRSLLAASTKPQKDEL